MKKIVLGIAGASGAPYARRLLEIVSAAPEDSVHVAVVMSPSARQVWAHEVGEDFGRFRAKLFDHRDFNAPFASGSSGYDAMAIVPCSMGTLARVAQGVSPDLMSRAADVMLKERRRLVLVVRESPYSLIHIDNMRRVTDAGAIVLPASPSFYGRPTRIDDLLDTVVGRVLDHLGVPLRVGPRWNEPSEEHL